MPDESAFEKLSAAFCQEPDETLFLAAVRVFVCAGEHGGTDSPELREVARYLLHSLTSPTGSAPEVAWAAIERAAARLPKGPTLRLVGG